MSELGQDIRADVYIVINMNYLDLDRNQAIDEWNNHPSVVELHSLGADVSTEKWFQVLLAIPRDLRQAYLRAIQGDVSDVQICLNQAIGDTLFLRD